MTKTVLVTGGNGYIGSHVIVELSRNGYQAVIYDSFETSKPYVSEVLQKNLCHKDFRPVVVEGNILDGDRLARTLREYSVESVIHLAGYKSVAESVMDPIKYAHGNIAGLISVLRSMQSVGIKNFVFSSSCTVYGNSGNQPIRESDELTPINPYGHSKLVCEQILFNISRNFKDWKIISLRYFNPIGAHPSGLIFDDPVGLSTNILPRIIESTQGDGKFFDIYGGDYNTKDGTAIRDYIHVVDLANAHMLALAKLSRQQLLSVNVGLGAGMTVLDLVRDFEISTGVNVPVRIVPRRTGDAEVVYCDTTLFRQLFPEWKTNFSVRDACVHAYSAFKRTKS